jgi:hypothetical protein
MGTSGQSRRTKTEVEAKEASAFLCTRKENLIMRYKNLGGDSGVVSYQNGHDRITVVFESGTDHHYLYTYASAGLSNIEQMKSLATQGQGLNSFINRNVKHDYERKW